MCSRKCWIVSFFFTFFLHLPHRQFSFIDLCLSSKMYWTFNCSWDNVMKWNVFSFAFMYVKAKLTLVSFFLLFFLCTFKCDDMYHETKKNMRQCVILNTVEFFNKTILEVEVGNYSNIDSWWFLDGNNFWQWCLLKIANCWCFLNIANYWCFF